MRTAGEGAIAKFHIKRDMAPRGLGEFEVPSDLSDASVTYLAEEHRPGPECHTLDADSDHTRVHHPQPLGRRQRNVDDPSAPERPTIVDAHDNGLADAVGAADSDFGAKGQAAVSGGERGRVVPLARGCLATDKS